MMNASPAVTPELQQMRDSRNENTITLYRVCSETEAQATVPTLLAGGQFRNLTQQRPTQAQVAQQVGNNETMPGGTIGAGAPERAVVEYSKAPAKQFDGTLISVRINQNFTSPGTGLMAEGGGGFVVQIGTPVASAQIGAPPNELDQIREVNEDEEG